MNRRSERDDAEYLLACEIEEKFAARDPQAQSFLDSCLSRYPESMHILISSVMVHAVLGDPAQSQRHLKTVRKLFYPSHYQSLFEILALARMGRWPQAQTLLKSEPIRIWKDCCAGLPPRYATEVRRWLGQVGAWTPVGAKVRERREPKAASPHAAVQPVKTVEPPVQDRRDGAGLSPLQRLSFSLPVTFKGAMVEAYSLLSRQPPARWEDWRLLHAYAQLSLVRGFDELLCLDQIHGVTSFWYQIETVRKVLKQFHGRVLLADEVGLGKTIEACMVMKEYVLRGMADRILVLTPPALVGQWEEELRSKFGMEFVVSHDSLLRTDPAAFWAQPRIIASLAAARTARNFEWVTGVPRDLVIVDEAHHLKDRRSRNWQVVDALQKRFLLLLSATPVQNNLVELYNLLTLLKPGLFKTESDFKASHMTPRQPRQPANRDRLQMLMRDVMIRNTRALVDVKLPPRQALTVRVEPGEAERDGYAALSEAIRKMSASGEGAHHRMALHHLLQAAGSSPAAATVSLERLAAGGSGDFWAPLRDRYATLEGETAKTRALLDILRRNPEEKKMVFARYTATLDYLSGVLEREGIRHARYDGSLTALQKDEAIAGFRGELPVLLCSEAGGEGRNVQFCNTLVNYDLHWNPQAIEQRIGRVHRIGQSREVFIFNLSVRHTLESRLLEILDEKINMFELVVGEIQAILGEMDEDHDLAELVFAAWTAETEAGRDREFAALESRLLEARDRYKEVREYDEKLFGEEFATA